MSRVGWVLLLLVVAVQVAAALLLPVTVTGWR
jgi:hypothetical protein